MPEPLTLTYMPDTLASEQRQSMNFVKREDLFLRGGAGQRVLAYILPRGLPMGSDVVVESAVLGLWPRAAAPSTQVGLRRPTQAWGSGGLTFANAPAVTGVVASTTAPLVVGTRFDIDVTAQVQAFCTGALPNYGFRLEVSATTGREFHSANARRAADWPVLIVTFSTKPEVPQGFVATGGAQVSVARPSIPWLYSDDAGSPMAAYQVQANPTDVWSGPAYDSGEVASAQPLHEWHTDISNGQTVWYRVRHKSASGRWSDWSDGQEFGRTAKLALSVTAPTGVVPDYTPTSTRTFAGTQTQHRVRFYDGEQVVADSSWRTGSDSGWAPSADLRVDEGVELVARWDVLDDVPRVSTPGDPAETTAYGDPFTIGPAAGIDPVTDLVAAPERRGPIVAVSWSRSSTPDGFIVERRIDSGAWRSFQVEPGDVALGGGNFRWRDATAPARYDLTYRVRPVVNGDMGDAPDEDATRYEPHYIWLIDPDDPDWVLGMAGTESGTWSLRDDSTVLHPLGSDRGVLVHEGHGGWEGSISGTILDQVDPTTSVDAQTLRDRAWRTKREPTKVWRLAVADLNIPVVVRAVNPAPASGPSARFELSFEFYQQGEVAWLPEGA